ncbi:2-phospho-L-lactate transferase [Agreia sp. COWG]|uniref:2-phospho-L-lactate transferase n=1 Tax=Agreia sp. COWG TaxID=2773266 RepID=UPI00192925CA|nr:2-phospho-L-lactate transferase [Agreia sp. COWG]CAD5994678.1 Phosphoenolpyruvate transferase [Agreia sp. COWG]
MKIAVLAGGVGGAKFLRGLRHHLTTIHPDGDGGHTDEVTAIVNTGDDVWLTGLKVCPDLDSIMYSLAGANDEVRGWGRAGESERVSAELTAFGVGWPWFTLGDLDLGTHIARSHHLREGVSLTEATARIQARWPAIGVRLLPVTDADVPTFVAVEENGMQTQIHFEEWWVKHRAALTAEAFVQRGIEASGITDEARDAILSADVVLIAPSNPVVSIGTILGIPGVSDALAATEAPVVGVSPIIEGSAVRGMAAACLTAIGVGTTAEAVGLHYGSRADGGILDAWLVDKEDADAVPALHAAGIRSRAVPLWMLDDATSGVLAAVALETARDISA